MLLTMCCPQAGDGWLAEELDREQSLENLGAFSRRLQLADKFLRAKPGRSKEKAKTLFVAAQIEAKGLRKLA